jgi:Recombinase zinc beta ribbon domain
MTSAGIRPPRGTRRETMDARDHRRKIARAAEEVIRLKVMDGLVSQELFQAVQQILKSRAAREQAVRTKNAPKYLFNGFLCCGVCDSPMYSHTNQKDHHYYCKRNGTRARKRNPESACPTPYIRAAVIEPKIEELLSVRLQDHDFLAEIAEAYLDRQSEKMLAGVSDPTAIQRQMENLTAKRKRILEAFFDGTIDRGQRDEQLGRVDAELKVYQGMVMKSPVAEPFASVGELANVFSAFAEMPFLQRDDKRSLLRGLGVEVSLSGYKICTLAMRNVGGLGCNTDNRLKTAP